MSETKEKISFYIPSIIFTVWLVVFDSYPQSIFEVCGSDILNFPSPCGIPGHCDLTSIEQKNKSSESDNIFDDMVNKMY